MISTNLATCQALVATAAREGLQTEADAAQKLQDHGAIDVHIAAGIDEHMDLKQLTELKALVDGRTDALSEDQKKTRDAVEKVAAKGMHFVRYEGQAQDFSSEYHAFNRTSLSPNVAQVLVESGYPKNTGIWGYQPAIGAEPATAKDGSIDQPVYHTLGVKEDVWNLADRLK